MEEKNVYRDISRRTDGDVYIGVVGPVRTGKSTFIKRCRKDDNDDGAEVYPRGVR